MIELEISWRYQNHSKVSLDEDLGTPMTFPQSIHVGFADFESGHGFYSIEILVLSKLVLPREVLFSNRFMLYS